MRIRGIVVWVIVCLMIALVSTSMPVHAAKTKAQIKESYKKYRVKHNLDYGKYKYVDIDGNGVVEMLYKDSTYEGVYTCDKKSGKVKKLKGVNVGKGYAIPLYYSKKKHQVLLATANTGGATGWLCKVKGKKITTVKIFDYANGKHEPGYMKINGKNVSEQRFREEQTKSVKGFKQLKAPGY